MLFLKELCHDILRYFDNRKITFKLRETENNALQRCKNSKEKIINHNATRMVKNGED